MDCAEQVVGYFASSADDEVGDNQATGSGETAISVLRDALIAEAGGAQVVRGSKGDRAGLLATGGSNHCQVSGKHNQTKPSPTAYRSPGVGKAEQCDVRHWQ